MKSGKKKVLVFGTFDGVHDGHRFFLRQAKERGDFLVVAVSKDNVVKSLKGFLPQSPIEKRIENLQKENIADLIVSSDEQIGTWQVLKNIRPDIICLGYDQVKLKEALNKAVKNFDWPVALLIIGDFKGDELHSSLIRKKGREGL